MFSGFRVLSRTILLLSGMLFFVTACIHSDIHTETKETQAPIPLVALDKACITPAPSHPDLYLTIAQQSVSRRGVWRAFPGWTIPVAIDASYRATLSIPTSDGYGYDRKPFKVTLASNQWRIAPQTVVNLSGDDRVGSPVTGDFVIVPNPPDAPPGTTNSPPPSASMIKIVLEGVETPDNKPVPPFTLRVVGSSESMPACPDTIIPGS